jgi:DNA-binding CsgD family transcriptional regulator/transcriptional regulator with XRE-family HTH domain
LHTSHSREGATIWRRRPKSRLSQEKLAQQARVTISTIWPTRRPSMRPAGLALLDANCNVLYSNSEAESILDYPKPQHKCDSSRIGPAKSFFSLFATDNFFSSSTSQSEFISGKRKYVCRAFRLTESRNGLPGGAATAVLLERSGAAICVAAQVSDRCHLTEREREVVELLIQGFTNKHIAERMNISANTVRAFVRLVMAKLGVSTRSGIVGIMFREALTAKP